MHLGSHLVGLIAAAVFLWLIVGYNETTGEIAISDSWGAYAEERWMLAEEAALISQDYLMVIKW